jgi:hypothetical protein
MVALFRAFGVFYGPMPKPRPKITRTRPTKEVSVMARIEDGHMGELESIMRVFFDSKPYRFSGKSDIQRRCVQYTMDIVEPVPAEIPLVVGDVIQNLRSALDQVAYHLYLKGGDGRGRAYHVYFPIFDSFEDYQQKKLNKLPGVSAAAVSKIDAIQPYKRGQ